VITGPFTVSGTLFSEVICPTCPNATCTNTTSLVLGSPQCQQTILGMETSSSLAVQMCANNVQDLTVTANVIGAFHFLLSTNVSFCTNSSAIKSDPNAFMRTISSVTDTYNFTGLTQNTTYYIHAAFDIGNAALSPIVILLGRTLPSVHINAPDQSPQSEVFVSVIRISPPVAAGLFLELIVTLGEPAGLDSTLAPHGGAACNAGIGSPLRANPACFVSLTYTEGMSEQNVTISTGTTVALASIQVAINTATNASSYYTSPQTAYFPVNDVTAPLWTQQCTVVNGTSKMFYFEVSISEPGRVFYWAQAGDGTPKTPDQIASCDPNQKNNEGQFNQCGVIDAPVAESLQRGFVFGITEGVAWTLWCVAEDVSNNRQKIDAVVTVPNILSYPDLSLAPRTVLSPVLGFWLCVLTIIAVLVA